MKRFSYSILVLIISIFSASAQNNTDAEKIINNLLTSVKTNAIRTNFNLKITEKNRVVLGRLFLGLRLPVLIFIKPHLVMIPLHKKVPELVVVMLDLGFKKNIRSLPKLNWLMP